jgi:hypothetical protein
MGSQQDHRLSILPQAPIVPSRMGRISSRFNLVLYNATNFNQATEAIEEFHKAYPLKPGPGRRLTVATTASIRRSISSVAGITVQCQQLPTVPTMPTSAYRCLWPLILRAMIYRDKVLLYRDSLTGSSNSTTAWSVPVVNSMCCTAHKSIILIVLSSRLPRRGRK